jgi:hypothetical protein
MTYVEKALEPNEIAKPRSNSLKERAKAKIASIQSMELSPKTKAIVESIKVLSNVVPGVYGYAVHYGIHINNIFLTHNPSMQINPNALKFAAGVIVSCAIYSGINKKQMKMIFSREHN